MSKHNILQEIRALLTHKDADSFLAEWPAGEDVLNNYKWLAGQLVFPDLR